MAFFVDTFTEASDTALASHAPDTGTGWTLLWQDGANPVINVIAASDTAKTVGQNNSGVMYTADATYPSADYDVQFTLVGGSNVAARPFFVALRLADIDNMYAVYISDFDPGSNASRLYKKVAGTWTALGSAFNCPALGSVCKLEIIGTALKFYDDGVEVASATDSDLSAAGKAGIGAGGGAELVTSTDDANSLWEIDTLSVTDLGSSGQTVAVNQVTETDTAQAIAKSKTKAVAQISETDTAQAIAKVKQLALAQISETDIAQSITARKVIAVGQVSETDTAQAITYVPAQTVVAVGQVSETNAAQAMTTRKIVAGGQVGETDAAQAISVAKARAVGQVAESDEAQALSSQKIKSLAQVVETDAAQAISVAKARAVGQVAESDEAQALSSQKIKSVGQVSETDAAQAITSLNGTLVNPVEETDQAQAITARKVREIGQVLESDAAQSLTVVRVFVVSQVAETDLAQALFPLKRVAVAQVVEIDEAQALGSTKIKEIGQVGETDASLEIQHAGAVFLGIASLATALTDVATLSDASLWTATLNSLVNEYAEVDDEPL